MALVPASGMLELSPYPAVLPPVAMAQKEWRFAGSTYHPEAAEHPRAALAAWMLAEGVIELKNLPKYENQIDFELGVAKPSGDGGDGDRKVWSTVDDVRGLLDPSDKKRRKLAALKLQCGAALGLCDDKGKEAGELRGGAPLDGAVPVRPAVAAVRTSFGADGRLVRQLVAAQALPTATVVGVLGNYVLPEEAHAELGSERGLAASRWAGSGNSRAVWRHLVATHTTHFWRLDSAQEELEDQEVAEDHEHEELLGVTLGYGNETAYLPDPLSDAPAFWRKNNRQAVEFDPEGNALPPLTPAQQPAESANCTLLHARVRGVPVRFVITERLVEAGEVLTRHQRKQYWDDLGKAAKQAAGQLWRDVPAPAPAAAVKQVQAPPVTLQVAPPSAAAPLAAEKRRPAPSSRGDVEAGRRDDPARRRDTRDEERRDPGQRDRQRDERDKRDEPHRARGDTSLRDKAPREVHGHDSERDSARDSGRDRDTSARRSTREDRPGRQRSRSRECSPERERRAPPLVARDVNALERGSERHGKEGDVEAKAPAVSAGRPWQVNGLAVPPVQATSHVPPPSGPADVPPVKAPPPEGGDQDAGCLDAKGGEWDGQDDFDDDDTPEFLKLKNWPVAGRDYPTWQTHLQSMIDQAV